MMAWITPKTNWNGDTVNGVYTGDYFTANDFNRIKNNLVYLRDFAMSMGFPGATLIELGEDRNYNDYVYADEINALETNFERINECVEDYDYGETPVFYPNGPMMDAVELNRLESAMLDVYNAITNVRKFERTFVWNFGIGAGL